MNLEVLVAEPSAENARRRLLPRIVGVDIDVEIQRFRGKDELLPKLPARLLGYARWAAATGPKIVILVDRDDDCVALKKRLEEIAVDARLPTLGTAAEDGAVIVLNRIAVEELEAWFFGDVPALRCAYPRRLPALASISDSGILTRSAAVPGRPSSGCARIAATTQAVGRRQWQRRRSRGIWMSNGTDPGASARSATASGGWRAVADA